MRGGLVLALWLLCTGIGCSGSPSVRRGTVPSSPTPQARLPPPRHRHRRRL